MKTNDFKKILGSFAFLFIATYSSLGHAAEVIPHSMPAAPLDLKCIQKNLGILEKASVDFDWNKSFGMAVPAKLTITNSALVQKLVKDGVLLPRQNGDLKNLTKLSVTFLRGYPGFPPRADLIGAVKWLGHDVVKNGQVSYDGFMLVEGSLLKFVIFKSVSTGFASSDVNIYASFQIQTSDCTLQL